MQVNEKSRNTILKRDFSKFANKTFRVIPSINIADYGYELSREKTAVFPLEERDSSKLLVYRKGEITEDVFANLPRYLESGTMPVFNNTKVIKARLLFRKETGAVIEVFCLRPARSKSIEETLSSDSECVWECAVGNAKKWKNEILRFDFESDGKTRTLTARKLSANEIVFGWDDEIVFGDVLKICGQVPIPPYIKRKAEETDALRYQTVYSKSEGSVAAPTAGLHFTDNVINALKSKSINPVEVTLHVGAGTFVPIKSPTVGEHVMHGEVFRVGRGTLEKLLPHVGNIIAVGTTSLRVLESLYHLGLNSRQDVESEDFSVSQWQAYGDLPEISAEESLSGLIERMYREEKETLYAATSIMIVPGYRFRMTKGLITNFHQPESTLILLVAALLGDDWRKVYDYALNHDFRFLSYGDSSLLMP